MPTHDPNQPALGSRLRRKAGRLRGISARQWGVLVEASAALISARLTLATTQFSDFARREGGFVAPLMGQSGHGAITGSKEVAEQIGWAVRSAAHHLPIKIVCLPQAMAARAMFKRRGISSVMHFGTGWNEDKPMLSHAWLDAADVEVTGYPIGEGLTEVACLA